MNRLADFITEFKTNDWQVSSSQTKKNSRYTLDIIFKQGDKTFKIEYSIKQVSKDMNIFGIIPKTAIKAGETGFYFSIFSSDTGFGESAGNYETLVDITKQHLVRFLTTDYIVSLPADLISED